MNNKLFNLIMIASLATSPSLMFAVPEEGTSDFEEVKTKVEESLKGVQEATASIADVAQQQEQIEVQQITDMLKSSQGVNEQLNTQLAQVQKDLDLARANGDNWKKLVEELMIKLEALKKQIADQTNEEQKIIDQTSVDVAKGLKTDQGDLPKAQPQAKTEAELMKQKTGGLGLTGEQHAQMAAAEKVSRKKELEKSTTGVSVKERAKKLQPK